jgi:DNA-binding transcriptional MerR regulator
VDKGPEAFRTISEVAEDLDLPQHVLRFWESRFAQIRPLKRGGGRRYYRPDDVELLRGIRHLLYGEGYTIRGVQRILKAEGARFVQSIWREEMGSERRLAPAATRPLSEPDRSALAQDTGDPDFADLNVDDPDFSDPDDGDDSRDGDDEIAHPAGRDERSARADPLNVVDSLNVVDALNLVDPPARQAARSASPPGPSAGLPVEAQRQLRTALAELSECRRLIAIARGTALPD